MRAAHWAAVVAGLVLALGSQPCQALDWDRFDDLNSVLLTDDLAKAIRELPAADKGAAIKRLHESLISKDVEIRRRAALTLGALGDKSGVPTMIADLDTSTGRDRDNVVVALRILKDDRATGALRKALQDKSPYVRGIALAALGEMKAAEAYDDIVAHTKDKGDRRAEKTDKNHGELNCFPSVPAEMACYALSALGDRRAIPVLIELLADKDLQRSALEGLEALTHQKLGSDPERWRAWWKQQAHR